MVTFQRSKNERRIKERGNSKETVGRGWKEENQTVRGCEEESGRQKKQEMNKKEIFLSFFIRKSKMIK